MKPRRCALAGTVALMLGGLVAGACATLVTQVPANVRKANYLASQRELSPEMAASIEVGRLSLGMNREQVWVVLGDPDGKTRFAADTEVWVYRAGRLHVNQLPDGIQAFRVVFTKDRLILVEPL